MHLSLQKMFVGCFGITALFFLQGSSDTAISITKYHQKNILNQNGAQPARTGAPGESNCTACHSGSAQDGNGGINELVINSGGTNYIAGSSIPMTLTLTDNAAKNGFELVALHTNDEMAGSFTITDNTNTKSVSSAFFNRQYVTHTLSGTSSNSWSFEWESPIEGGDVTFYVATNKTNSDSKDSLDLIYLSQHTFTAPDVSGISEEKIEENFKLFYNSEKNRVEVEFEVTESSDISFNIINLAGQSIYFKEGEKYTPGEYKEIIHLPENLENGIYITTIFKNNKAVSKKFRLSK